MVNRRWGFASMCFKAFKALLGVVPLIVELHVSILFIASNARIYPS
jgi:hypothetical protein